MATRSANSTENETELTVFRDSQLIQEFQYELLCQQRDITNFILREHKKINKVVLKALKKLDNWANETNAEKLMLKWEKKAQKHPSYMIQMDIGSALQDWREQTEKGILDIKKNYLSVVNTGSVQISFTKEHDQTP